MTPSNERPWMSEVAADRYHEIAASMALTASGEPDTDAVAAHIESLVEENRTIHEVECVNLNPATNVTNPRAEALLARGLGSRPSLGYAGEKYEMGLEAIEQIEVITTELVRRVFGATYAEVRVPSGALANLFAFMATCSPGDRIIVPPPTVGGHVTHQDAGAAGLFGLEIHYAPIDPDRYTVDVDALAVMAQELRPRLITVGASLNLLPHPVAELRRVADEVDAHLLFDAAHACGMFASRQWPNPLDEGAHLMTMSTYKSLGGPAGGLVLTNDAALAERIEAIAYPGLTANFDAGKTAALAVTMLDWVDHGEAYGAEMVATASRLAAELAERGVAVFSTAEGSTRSHQFAIDIGADAAPEMSGHEAAVRLREANVLTCAIGLPHDAGAGLRLGTPETVRWGMGVDHMAELADLIARALHGDPGSVRADVKAFRARFDSLHHVSLRDG